MATGNRTLKLSILADVDDLKKKLGDADKAVESNASKISEFGKKAALAFTVAAAAAVAYAGKLAIDGVKSAIEDEQAQLRLASALKTATGATDAQIKATEEYITKTQLATGVTDNDLRNAFQRLSVSTKDVNTSQKLLNLALDVAAGSGKDLTTVTSALAKAYDGQETQLARLGIGLSAADLKAMDFTETQKALSNLYGGAAARNAETFQGRIDRLKQGFEEAKETVGAALLLIDVGAKAAAAIINAFGAIAGAITPVLNFIIDAINTVIRGINLVKPGQDIASLNKIGQLGQATSNFSYNQGNPLASASNAQTQPTVINNISVQAIDPEGAARAVQKVLVDSSARSTPTFGGGFGIVFQ